MIYRSPEILLGGIKSLQVSVSGIYNGSGCETKLTPSVLAFGHFFKVTDIIKNGGYLRTSNVYPFLCGETVRCENCVLDLTVRDYGAQCLRSELNSELGQETESVLKKLFKPLVSGVDCNVDNWGTATLAVESDSWKVLDIQQRNYKDFRLNVYQLNVSFRASLKLKNVPSACPRSFFNDGICCKGLSWGSKEQDQERQVVMGILTYWDQLYVGDDGCFAMAWNKDRSNTKEILLQEAEVGWRSIYDFARMAAFVVGEDASKSIFLKYGKDWDFCKLMYGSRVSLFVKLGDEAVSNDFFELDMPKLIQQVQREYLQEGCAIIPKKCVSVVVGQLAFACDLGGAGRNFYSKLGEVVTEFLNFCKSVTDFYKKHIVNVGGSDKSPFWRLAYLVWSKIELDPLLYVDSNDKILSSFARTIICQ